MISGVRNTKNARLTRRVKAVPLRFGKGVWRRMRNHDRSGFVNELELYLVVSIREIRR